MGKCQDLIPTCTTLWSRIKGSNDSEIWRVETYWKLIFNATRCQQRFENHVFQKSVGAFIPPFPGTCQSESRLGLLGLEHSRYPFEEGKSVGAQSGRKRPQEHGKTGDFKPATFRKFRNDAENPTRGDYCAKQKWQGFRSP
jgi:hypothetical protein